MAGRALELFLVIGRGDAGGVGEPSGDPILGVDRCVEVGETTVESFESVSLYEYSCVVFNIANKHYM